MILKDMINMLINDRENQRSNQEWIWEISDN